MPTVEDHAGLFLLAATDVPEIQRLIDEGWEARRQNAEDHWYRRGLAYMTAERNALASYVVSGPASWGSVGVLDEWLGKRILGMPEVDVFGPDHLRTIRSGLEHRGLKDLLRWSKRKDRVYDRVDQDQLRDLFKQLHLLLAREPVDEYGLLLRWITDDQREPPKPREPEPESPPLVGLDLVICNGATLDGYSAGSTQRRHNKTWFNCDEGEGRFLLGMLTPAEGVHWLQVYEHARSFLKNNQYALAWQHAREMVTGLSEAMHQGQVFTRCGPVMAIRSISTHTWMNVDRDAGRPQLSPPEQLPSLWQGLDQAVAGAGSEDKLIKRIWREERYWPRELAQDAYHQLRRAMTLARERQMYLVWFWDNYTYLRGFYDPVRSRPWLHADAAR